MGSYHYNDEAARTGTASATPSTDFASERPAEWQEPPALALDETGFIQKCSESCAKLFGYQGPDLVKQHISSLFPQLSGHKLMMDGRFNPMLDFLCHCGHLFQTQNSHGDTFKSELSFVRIESGGQRSLRLLVRPLAGGRLPQAFRHDHAM